MSARFVLNNLEQPLSMAGTYAFLLLNSIGRAWRKNYNKFVTHRHTFPWSDPSPDPDIGYERDRRTNLSNLEQPLGGS